MPVLPLILAPAALIAPAQSPAVHGPAVEGIVLNQAGKPLAASIGLIPMFQRDEPFPSRTVANQIGKSKKRKPGFLLPASTPGLYLLDVRANGCQALQIPVILGEEGMKGIELTPVPIKHQGDVRPISPDDKLVKLEALYAAQKERETNYRKSIKARLEQKAKNPSAEKGSPLDWTGDLETLSTDLHDETDADIQSLAAVSYLELGMMMAPLDQETAALALDKLPPTSAWWAFNPRIAGSAFAASNRSGDWGSFREALSTDNPDSEVRAYGLYSQMSSAFNKGDKEKFTALMNTLTSEYKGTKFAKSAKAFDPAKMPAPTVAPTPLPELEPSAPAPAPTENPAPPPAPEESPVPPAPAQP